MRKIGLVVVFGLIFGSAMAQYDDKARVILDAMSDKYSKISAYKASIKSSLINEVDGVNEDMEGEITIKGDMFRLKIDDQEIFNDGSTVWTYLAEANEVNIDNYDPDEEEITPAKILNIYKEGYKYLHLEESTQAGKLCDVVDLIPENAKDTQFFKIRMFVSQKDRSLVSWTMFEKSGNRYKYLITNFTTGIKVDDSHFRFDASKYPDVEVIDLR